MNAVHRWRIDVEAACTALRSYLDAVNAGRFLDAMEHRDALLGLGLVVVHQPGKSLAALRAEQEAGRASATEGHAGKDLIALAPGSTLGPRRDERERAGTPARRSLLSSSEFRGECCKDPGLAIDRPKASRGSADHA